MPEGDISVELVAATLRHDEASAQELVRQLYPLVSKLVHAHRPSRTDHEDLCQMIFIKVLQNLPQFSGRVPLEHWVSRIAINTCINQVKFQQIRPEVRHADLTVEQAAFVTDMAATNSEPSVDQRFASLDLVENLMRVLKPAERLVIDLMYLQGQSVADIQRVTGWGKSLIKIRAFRARHKMKNYLQRVAQTR